MSGEKILSIPMSDNDANAKTIGDYLIALLLTLWNKGECFSGKRPLGNSGWQYDLYLPLIKAGAIKGTLDEDGFIKELSSLEQAKADSLISEAIQSLWKGTSNA